jgi:hypothetical protein
MIGLEPERIGLGIGLSPSVQASLGMAASFARMTVNRLLKDVSGFSFLVSGSVA